VSADRNVLQQQVDHHEVMFHIWIVNYNIKNILFTLIYLSAQYCIGDTLC
jgi:hypothetical protein